MYAVYLNVLQMVPNFMLCGCNHYDILTYLCLVWETGLICVKSTSDLHTLTESIEVQKAKSIINIVSLL